MGWLHREQQKTKQQARAEQQAAEQAQKDQEAAARQQLTNSWKDLYNTGGDLAVAESILSGQANGGTYTAQDIAAAKKVKEGGTTFGQIGQEAFQKSYDTWNMVTGNGQNTTKYGPQAQSIYQLMPFDDWSKDVQRFEWSDGSYDERIKSEKAAADKAAADKAAADKAAADAASAADAAKRQADLDEAQRQKDAAAQAALQKKPEPTPTPQAPVKKETPIEEAKGRAEEYTNTTTQNGNTITNNITQNVGNKGDMKTEIGDDNTITNSEIGNDKSENTGSINVTNQQTQEEKNNDFVWGLANERASAYRANAAQRVSNGNSTSSNAYTFDNNFLQNTGNKGNMTTSFGNNNSLNNVRAGNDYSINLGNINSSNYSM